MEAPPNLNATAQSIEFNENKMSCRATMSPRQLIAVLPLFDHLRADVIP